MKIFVNIISKMVLFLLFYMGSFSFALYASQVSADNELTQLLDNIHTMQATFEQSLTSEHGTQIGNKVTGKVAIERPGKFRWEIIKPDEQLIIVNNNRMLIYDASLAQLTKRSIDINRSNNPAMLLSSSVTSLKQHFQTVKLKANGSNLWFKLIPKTLKNEEVSYNWLKIHFLDGQLKTMYIFDNMGQTSVIKFNNQIINTKISSQKFTFTPPSNTDVFDAK